LHGKEQLMNLERYIQGIRKGREINSLEREAMQDPFLADALEGYDRVKGEHLEQIDEMKKQITQRTRSNKGTFRTWAIAACILVLIGGGGYLLWEEFPFSINDYFSGYREVKPEINVLVSELEKTAKKKSDSLSREPDSYLNKLFAFYELPVVPPLEIDFFYEKASDSIASNETEEKPLKEEKPPMPKDIPLGPKPGVGYREYESYLKKQIVRPSDDDCTGIKGKVVLSFSVDGNGRPYNINVIKSLCPSADTEAIRLLREGPGWKSGDKDGRMEVRF
jgi:hypothetical protein